VKRTREITFYVYVDSDIYIEREYFQIVENLKIYIFVHLSYIYIYIRIVLRE